MSFFRFINITSNVKNIANCIQFPFIFYFRVVPLYLSCLLITIGPLSAPLHPSASWLVQPNCWWNAESQECMPCRCSPHGSMSQRCDVEGRCICRPGFVGRRCDLRRRGYERRETRRPVERIPMEAVQQRWGGSSRTGGCPRGAYRPKTGVTHTACGCQWCVSHGCVFSLDVWRCAAKGYVCLNRFKTQCVCIANVQVFAFVDLMTQGPEFSKCRMEMVVCWL